MDQIDFNRIPLHARRSAVGRVDVSPHVLDLLATDPDPSIRRAVAEHPATPLEVLARLTGDTVAMVAAAARLRALAQRVVSGSA